MPIRDPAARDLARKILKIFYAREPEDSAVAHAAGAIMHSVAADELDAETERMAAEELISPTFREEDAFAQRQDCNKEAQRDAFLKPSAR